MRVKLENVSQDESEWNTESGLSSKRFIWITDTDLTNGEHLIVNSSDATDPSSPANVGKGVTLLLIEGVVHSHLWVVLEWSIS